MYLTENKLSKSQSNKQYFLFKVNNQSCQKIQFIITVLRETLFETITSFLFTCVVSIRQTVIRWCQQFIFSCMDPQQVNCTSGVEKQAPEWVAFWTFLHYTGSSPDSPAFLGHDLWCLCIQYCRQCPNICALLEIPFK